MEISDCKGMRPNKIQVSEINVEWNPTRGTCTFEKLPVAMMWVDTTLAGLMSGVQAMVGTQRFSLALQSEGRKSVETDWEVISKFPDFREGFKAIANIAAIAGWGAWVLMSVDEERKECRFRVTDSWEGNYQRALGVCWGSGMLAGKMAGYCSKLFKANCWADQTAFIAKGAAHDEFIVRPSSRSIEQEIEELLATDGATRADMAVALRKLENEIAERKRAEEELSEKHRQLQETVTQLEQARNMLHLVIESIPVRVFWKDRDQRYLGCNTLFARDAGLSQPEELLGLDDFAMSWREQAELYRADDRQIMESGVPKMNIVEPQTTPAGSKIWLNTCKVPLHLPNGEVFGVLGVYEDITERRRTVEALSLRESYLTAIIENQPGLVWLKDTEGRFLSVNHAFVRSCGRQRPEEVVGKTGLDIWPRELAEKYRNDDGEVMTRHVPVVVEERILDQGVVKWFQTFKTPVFTTDGQVLGTCGFALDVTERKRAEEERIRLEERLQRAEKMEALGTLAGGVAHDLNNVLGIVVGYSELLLADLDDSSSARSEAMEILKGAQRAAAIVQDLLTLARRGIQGRKALNLNNILLECMKSPQFANVLSYHHNIDVKTDFEVDLLNISGSSVHLEKSFLNLVSNAAEAMSSGGTLTVKTRNQYRDKPVLGYDEVKEGDYVVLSVSDTGEGIPASDLKRIFEPFYTKKVMGRSGTGLGLAVVWGTVKDHHGYINAESEEGKGTVFTLYFPVTREDITPEQVSISASEYTGDGESVLIVDDVKEQRDLAVKMLTKLNYVVSTVSSGEEALEYLERHAVDLVVLDMIMDPGMDGLDTYTKILEMHPHQKAIIASGFSETERVGKAQALGAGAYVKKPYVLQKLGLAIRKELDRPA